MSERSTEAVPHSPLTPLNNVQACVFDAYGTLFDPRATMARARDRIGDKVALLTTTWRSKQRRLAIASAQSDEKDYWHITGAALDETMAELGIVDAHLRARLMQLTLNMDAFPDALPVLRRLKDAGVRTGILSDGTTTMLLSATKHSGLHEVVDQVISTESARVFKPDPAAYALASERLRVAPEAICYISGDAWDAEAAAQAGLRAAWVERGGEPARVALKLKDLNELPDLLGS